MVQSIIFEKAYFDKSEAEAWAKEHDFKTNKVDVTENTYRFRQYPPSRFSTFRIKPLTEGVKAVIAR